MDNPTFPSATARARVRILDVAIDRVSLAAAVELCRGFMAAGRPHLVVTPNAEILYAARRNPALTAALAAADLAVADGAGVVLAARWLGRPVPERVAGVDLMDGLLKAAGQAAAGCRVYLLGTRPEIVARAAARLPDLYPGVRVVGHHHGFFAPADTAGIIDGIRQAAPHLLLVGLGSPRQELWLQQHHQATGAAVSIGIGGGIDLLAGAVRRAPRWMRRLHLEWLYRVLVLGRIRRSVPPLVGFLFAVLRQRLGAH